MRKDIFKLKPKHKWFAAPECDWDSGWFGPHDTLEAALLDCASVFNEANQIYISQGFKLTKQQKEDWGVEFNWQVNSAHLMRLVLNLRKT